MVVKLAMAQVFADYFVLDGFCCDIAGPLII
jgi:hypothetical protein